MILFTLNFISYLDIFIYDGLLSQNFDYYFVKLSDSHEQVGSM